MTRQEDEEVEESRQFEVEIDATGQSFQLVLPSSLLLQEILQRRPGKEPKLFDQVLGSVVWISSQVEYDHLNCK